MSYSDDGVPTGLPASVFAKVVEAIGCEAQGDIPGYRLEPLTGFRGETRVWRLSEETRGDAWYVKRCDESRIFRRYLEAMSMLQEAASAGTALVPVTCAGKDADQRVIATSAVSGTLASDFLVAGARLDKLLSWSSVDLRHLGYTVARGLQAVWRSRGSESPDLEQYTPVATSERIERKFLRLCRDAPEDWRCFADRVTRVCAILASEPYEPALSIGDVDLANMLIADDAVCFFDLDDIGVGDWQRDLSCLLHRLELARHNWKYAGHRVDRLRKHILQELPCDVDERRIAVFQVELQLDAIWSALHFKADNTLPRHGRALGTLTRGLDAVLGRATA